MSAPRATAVIVTYNSRDGIGQTLDSLRDAQEAREVDVVVVDNRSSDGTARFVGEAYPWVDLRALDENVGFGRGCNEGVRSAKSPYILLLNPDAVISREDLHVLLDFMDQRPGCGIAAPAIPNQHAGGLTTPGGLVRQSLFHHVSADEVIIDLEKESFRTSWVCGAVFCIRTDLYHAVGGMDPRYFLYFEETDLCLATQRRGFEVWVVTSATAQHVGGVSAGQAGDRMENGCLAEHYYPSRFYYLGKNFGWLRAAGAELVALGALGLRSLVRALRGRKGRSLGDRLRGGVLRLPARPVSDVGVLRSGSGPKLER